MEPRSATAGLGTFEQLAAQGDDVDVAMGVALLARDVYGDVEPASLLRHFDAFAAPLVARGLANLPLREQHEALAQRLFIELDFHGNEEDYYDPKNSLLPDVIERRMGIPISLALVYCEVAKRASVRARGVPFPGHFLVRLDGGPERDGREPPLFVDPFFRGRVLDGPALEALLARVAGQSGAKPEMKPEYLAPAAPRAILLRWLHNLRATYLSRGQLPAALLVVDRIVTLSPDEIAPLRDRGLLAAKLGANEAARADLERVATMDPNGAIGQEAKTVLGKLPATTKTKSSLN
jgi:regulator of sirC expression with transglutaminase-like and TPR domain